MPPPGFDELTLEQKEAYVEALMSRIRTPDVPDWHRVELAQRRSADVTEPVVRQPWREAIQDLRASGE